MNRPLCWMCTLIGILLIPTLSPAAPKPADIAARIDGLMQQTWQEAGIKPAEPASDGEFLRRASLDLNGIVPPVSEVRAFLKSTDPTKRQALIQDLLSRPRYAIHQTNYWAKLLVDQAGNQGRFNQDALLRTWLYEQFVDHIAYDQIVRNIVLAEGNANQSAPVAFYTSRQADAAEVAAAASRTFLGVQLSCAQCHDHPFDQWKREDFWGFAAFFGRVGPPENQRNRNFVFQIQEHSQGDLLDPDTNQPLTPKFLSGQTLDIQWEGSRRQKLADWMTSPENPYFAKAIVNRVWAQLFGLGLMNPVDDLGSHNPATHPQVLAELEQYLIDCNYELGKLYQAIALTQAYQLSSRGHDQEAELLFARMPIKSLTAEQFYDCLQEATRMSTSSGTRANRFNGIDQQRSQFIEKFESPNREATVFEAGIPQALTLINGSLIQDATDLENSDLLNALQAPFLSRTQKVEILFLSTLSRFPRPEEQDLFLDYVSGVSEQRGEESALSDVLWALLNSAEFMLNH